MSISYILSDSGSISAFVKGSDGKGRSITLPPDHVMYEQALDALRNQDADKFIEMADVSNSINKFGDTEGFVKVVDGAVFYNDQPIHNTITDRILNFLKQGLPHKPMMLFLNNLMENPSGHSVRQLYTFLEHQKLPITEDGCFLAYKRVGEDWKDLHTQSIDNSVGQTVKMKRNEVDDDYSHDCSYGLHVGSIEYVKNFSSGGHLVLVKVNPRDAVSVPQYATNKMRVCEYYVQEEITPESIGLSAELYRAENNSSVSEIYSNDEEDEFEDEDEDDYENDSDDDFENEICDEEDEENHVLNEKITQWCTKNGISTNYFENDNVKYAVENKDAISLIQFLYAIALRSNDDYAQAFLENNSNKQSLIDLLS